MPSSKAAMQDTRPGRTKSVGDPSSMRWRMVCGDRADSLSRYSKEYIESLESEIVELKQALQQYQSNHSETNESEAGRTESQVLSSGSPDEIRTPPSDDSSPPNNLIERLCGANRRRDGNGDGQSRYFGPTSSLHFTETPTTLTINGDSSRHEAYAYENLTQETQELCLNLYWTYQHPVLCCIHKEAFLEGMKAGCGPYFSRCLLYCVLASGARISERREIRAMTIPTTEEEKLEKRLVVPM